MANKKASTSFKSTQALARRLGFTKAEAEIIAMKGTVIGMLDNERERRDLNNTEFAEFLGIPKPRWSSLPTCQDSCRLRILNAAGARKLMTDEHAKVLSRI